MNEFPYFPGTVTGQQYQPYNAYQQALWDAFDDTFRAMVGGYEHTRRPTPGKEFNLDGFDAWQEKCIKQWAIEAHRDPGTRGPAKEELPRELWLYLYERMLDAGRLKPETDA